MSRLEEEGMESADGYGVSFSGAENVLELDSCDGHTNLWIYPKPLKCLPRRQKHEWMNEWKVRDRREAAIEHGCEEEPHVFTARGRCNKGSLLAVRDEGFYTVSDMEKSKIHERGEQLMKLTFWEGSRNRGRGIH